MGIYNKIKIGNVKKYYVLMSNLPGSLESKKTYILNFKTNLLSRQNFFEWV